MESFTLDTVKFLLIYRYLQNMYSFISVKPASLEVSLTKSHICPIKRNRQWMIIHVQVKKLDATIHVPVAAV